MNAKTHPQMTDHVAAFEDDSDDQVVHYGSPSALAITSLLLGIAAPLAFVAPLLMAIPVFGTALALVALYRISSSEGLLIGRRAALIGLALCVVSGTAAVSRSQTLRSIRSDQAQTLVRQWIDLIGAGRIEPAFRLTYRGAVPEPPAPEGMPGEAPEKVDPLQEFKDDPTILAIGAAGQDATLRWNEDLFYQAEARGGCTLRQQYHVLPTSQDASSEPIDLVVTMQLGRIPGDSNPRWLVGSYETGDTL